MSGFVVVTKQTIKQQFGMASNLLQRSGRGARLLLVEAQLCLVGHAGDRSRGWLVCGLNEVKLCRSTPWGEFQ